MKYEVAALGSEVRIHFFGDAKDAEYELSWVDGERRMATKAQNGHQHVLVDDDRLQVTWGYPLLTPFLLNVFDVRATLADVSRMHATTIEAMNDGTVTLSGEVRVDGAEEVDAASDSSWDWPWRVTAHLNPARGHLPDLITAELDYRGKRIRWNMRTEAALQDSGGWYIAKALIWMENNGLPPGQRERWQIYAYEVEERTAKPLTKAALVVPIPRSNATVVNELERTARTFGSSGTVMREQTWTAEERAAQMKTTLEANNAKLRLAEENAALRKRAFVAVIAGAGLVTLVLFAWRKGWLTRTPFR